MMKKHHPIHSRKEFLNKPFYHSDASVFSEVEIWEEEKEVSLGIVLELRDCWKKINLAFSVAEYEDLENSLFKVDTLINHLEVFRPKLIEAHKLNKKILKSRENESTITGQVVGSPEAVK